MAEGSVRFQCQSPVTCNVCHAQFDVLWYCNTCDDNLCTDCNNNHGNTNNFPKHTVVSLFEALRQKSEIKESCVKHQDNFYAISCNDCHELVCSDCVADEHKGHKLGKIPEVMESTCLELQEYADKLESDLLAQCSTEEANISVTAKTGQMWLANQKSLVEKQQKDLKAEIDDYCNSILLTAQNESDKQMSELDQAREKIQNTVREISQLQMKAKDLQEKRNSETMQFQKEKPSISNIEIPRFNSLTLPTFHLGKIDSKLVKEQIGTFQKPEIENQKQGTQFTDKQEVAVTKMQFVGAYNKSKFSIGSILTVGKNKAWINFRGTNRINLVHVAENDHQYEVKNLEMPFVIDDIAVLGSDRIIATEFQSTSIKTFTQEGEVTDTFDTAPDRPTGICLTNNQQNVAVCITDQNNSVKLVLYSLEGNIQKEIPYTNKKVNSPDDQQRVKQSQNGDYSILNWYLQTVFVVDDAGVSKFSYNGSDVSGLTTPFRPSDISYDSYGQLLITDHDNHMIHIVDQQGSVNKIVNTAELDIKIPRSLDVDEDGKVWIGHGIRLISVLKD